ncbi:sigma 54-interacting transcriptional regulator [Phormidium sp. CCY1219]|uniref:sigma 54-interacting transcriptional regulator n=1 Tax=Phormidium sp. CCY1219 TaxID=2886104 RepID=UPI002D1F909A|nr:sigma 54-interacting transcriptional regulator [Phormidium sp. CCY1219]MEB3830976.1 sigma 54-interacting transcriptional regulator [Phormidium sp. CCY1219]
MSGREWVTWLSERTTLGILSKPALKAIAQMLEEKVVDANEVLAREETPPTGLYILKQGRLEVAGKSRQRAAIASDPKNPASLLPGSVIHLQELILDQNAGQTVTTLTECHLWFVPRDRFGQLVQEYPEIAQTFSRFLVEKLADVSEALDYEQQRQNELRPYAIAKAKRGIVGKSRYAARLRQQIREAGSDRLSVFIFGEPGLEKDNTAALIHFGSPARRSAIVKIDCGILQTSGAELFGRAGGKPGLLEWLGEGTLVLNNIEELPSELTEAIAHLLETQTYTPVTRSGDPPPSPKTCQAKIIAIGERRLPQIERHIQRTIKVPPLRVRKADIAAQVDYYTSLYCRAKGLEKPHLTPEALRRLQAYDFPGNIRELQNLVERAIVQSDCASELTEEIFWSAQSKKKQFRVNLLNAYPRLRNFLRSPWWPDRINYGFTFAFFALVVALLFLGPQTRDRNLALNLFWAWWWPVVLFAFPFVGRLWCAICPFMIYGEITQKLSLWLFPRKLKYWPRQDAEKWGGWFLFGLFALIFLWEELWNLENTAYLSACLLLLITAGAMIFSAIFERRFWCRYLCPIGGMNGLFAKLSMTELRAQQGTCSAECTTYQCYKGGPQKGEGMATNGCPLYSHPAQLEDNRDCVLCMTCLKACPHRSVEFNLRPPGIELWTTHVPRSYEVALLLLLLGGIFLHRLPEINAQLEFNVDLTQFWPHFALSVAALLVPVSVPFLAHGAMKLFDRQPKPKPFLQLAYGYLPLVLGGSLAHYLRLGLTEAGRILPVSFATFGLSGEGLPIWVAHPAVIEFLQGTTLMVAVGLTVVLTQKIARQPVRSLLPQHLATVVLAACMWAIIVR